MNLDYITEQLLLWLPTIIALMDSVILPILWRFAQLDTERKINDLDRKLDILLKNNDDLKNENIILKKKLNQTLTELDHIRREDK